MPFLQTTVNGLALGACETNLRRTDAGFEMEVIFNENFDINVGDNMTFHVSNRVLEMISILDKRKSK